MSALTARFRDLPRAARWLLWGGALVLAYFAVVEPVLGLVNRLNAESDRREAALAVYAREGGARAASQRAIESGVARFGLVAPPGEPEARSVAFNTTVAKVLAAHGLKEDSTTRTATQPSGPLSGVVGEGSRVERLVKELQFSGTPEQISAVVADLERAPEIAAISRVQISRPTESEGAGRTLKAIVWAEAWTVARKGRTR